MLNKFKESLGLAAKLLGARLLANDHYIRISTADGGTLHCKSYKGDLVVKGLDIGLRGGVYQLEDLIKISKVLGMNGEEKLTQTSKGYKVGKTKVSIDMVAPEDDNELSPPKTETPEGMKTFDLPYETLISRLKQLGAFIDDKKKNSQVILHQDCIYAHDTTIFYRNSLLDADDPYYEASMKDLESLNFHIPSAAVGVLTSCLANTSIAKQESKDITFEFDAEYVNISIGDLTLKLTQLPESFRTPVKQISTLFDLAVISETKVSHSELDLAFQQVKLLDKAPVSVAVFNAKDNTVGDRNSEVVVDLESTDIQTDFKALTDNLTKCIKPMDAFTLILKQQIVAFNDEASNLCTFSVLVIA